MRNLILAAAMAALPVAADAAVSILGGGLGRDCYLAAESGSRYLPGLEACNRALENEVMSPRDRAATFVNRGIVRMQAKELSAAIADFDLALKTQPRTAEAYVNKGIALIHLGGQDTQAVALLTQGIAMNPVQPEIAYYVRGIAHEQIGATKAAYEDYIKAASLKPGWAEPAEQLSRFKVERRPTAAL